MPNRDILWILPNGTTTVVTVDEHGEPVEPIPGAPEPPEDSAEVGTQTPPQPIPAPKSRHPRRKR